MTVGAAVRPLQTPLLQLQLHLSLLQLLLLHTLKSLPTPASQRVRCAVQVPEPVKIPANPVHPGLCLVTIVKEELARRAASKTAITLDKFYLKCAHDKVKHAGDVITYKQGCAALALHH